MSISSASSVPSRGLQRRALVQAAACFALLPAARAANAEMALSVAINRAGRFRALSQRCAKAYCQLFLDVLPDNARETLASAQRLIQLGFEDLTKGGLPPPAARQLQALQQEATGLAALVATAPSKAAVAGAATQSDRMLAAANRLTEALQEQSRQGSAKLINVAGRQRLLSQRVARNYFLLAAGQDGKPPLREQIVGDLAEFKDGMATLQAAPISTPSIRNELALAESQWTFFNAAVNRKPEPEALRTVATTSERLLEVTNNLTNLYDAALRDLLGAT